MTLPFKLVSADSHIVEPPDLWLKHIDKKFRDRAPRIDHAARAATASSARIRRDRAAASG